MTQPWSKFFWSDYASDPALKLCSLAAQGLWMRMLCIAAEHDPVGYVAVNGEPLQNEDIARAAGCSLLEAEKLITELDRRGVFSRDRRGWIYSRRMIEEAKMRRKASEWGKQGGNPSLRKRGGNSGGDKGGDKGGVGKRDKPHMPEARGSVDKSTAANAAVDPVKIIFDLGVALLTDQGYDEKRARSLIGKWRKDARSDGDVAAALIDAQSRNISNLVEWMPRRLASSRLNGSGAKSLVDQVLEEKERQDRRQSAAPG